MGLLDKLWDDTRAGPKLEVGLGKLRKFASFSFRSNSGDAESQAGNGQSSFQEESTDDAKRVTRSIMIIKPPSTGHGQTESPLVSPAGVSPPVSPAGGSGTPPLSPFAGGGGREALRFRRRSSTFAYERSSGVGPYSPPPPYDM